MKIVCSKDVRGPVGHGQYDGLGEYCGSIELLYRHLSLLSLKVDVGVCSEFLKSMTQLSNQYWSKRTL